MTTSYFILWLIIAIFPWSQASESKSLDPSHFSLLGVTIGEDNLETLQKKLGAVQKCRSSQHDGVQIAAYTDSNEDLVFEFGEVGGGDVTGFYLSSQRFAVPGCRVSHLRSKSSLLTTKAGVRLGMTQDEFLRIFGSPKSQRGGVWKYDWTREEKYSEAEKQKAANAGNSIGNTYLVGITIEARFAKGVLKYFYISKLETT